MGAYLRCVILELTIDTGQPISATALFSIFLKKFGPPDTGHDQGPLFYVGHLFSACNTPASRLFSRKCTASPWQLTPRFV